MRMGTEDMAYNRSKNVRLIMHYVVKCLISNRGELNEAKTKNFSNRPREKLNNFL